MTEEERFNNLIEILESERAPLFDLDSEEMKVLATLALFKGAKNDMAAEDFTGELRERIAKELGMGNAASDEGRLRARRMAYRGLAAAAALALAVGAFQLGRTLDDSGGMLTGTKVASSSIAKELGFGKLPWGGGNQGSYDIRSNLYRNSKSLESQATDAYSAPYTSTLLAPDGNVSAVLGWKIDYVWAAGEPKFPDKIKVYKSDGVTIDKQKAYEIAKKLGFGKARSITISNPDSPDESSSFDFEKNTGGETLHIGGGGFYYGSSSLESVSTASGGTTTNGSSLEEKQAIEIATGWLRRAGLLPARYKAEVRKQENVGQGISYPERGVAPTPVEPDAPVQSDPAVEPSIKQWIPPVSVDFILDFDGLPQYYSPTSLMMSGAISSSTFVSVDVSVEGKVISANGSIDTALISSLYPLKSAKEAFEEASKSQSGIMILPQTATKGPDPKRPETFTVKEVKLAYARVYKNVDRRVDTEPSTQFFEPVYIFKGTLEGVNGRYDGVEVAVPAIKGEHIEDGNNKTVPMPPSSSGASPGVSSGGAEPAVAR